jgi:hypothetical protein
MSWCDVVPLLQDCTVGKMKMTPGLKFWHKAEPLKTARRDPCRLGRADLSQHHSKSIRFDSTQYKNVII